MKSDLIVFGEDWGGLPSSTQHLVQHLAATRKVLWVNSIGLRQPRLCRSDLKRAWRKLTAAGSAPPRASVATPPGMKILDLVTIPAPRGRLARKLAAAMLERQLLPAIREAGLHDPILWTSLPTAADLVGRLGERAAVYYCGDDFSALAGVDHATVSRHETELRHKAQLIVAASARLRARFPGEATRLLTHGVDFDLFSKPAPRAADLPASARPVAGFYGSLSEWLDVELLCGLARRLPHWDLVLIGRADIDTGPLRRLDNVFLLGPRPHRALPAYSQHWQASLLPFRQNAQIAACNPLKLTEYLAAGSPVVSTPFPALQPYRDLVSVADDAETMAAALEHSLRRSDRGAWRERARERVAAHSWQSRAAELETWLEAL